MPSGEHILFYDGACGLCHGFVKFTARRDLRGRFRFAPVGGSLFTELIAEPARAQLPESLVLYTTGGEVLTRSDAVLLVLDQLGAWRWVAVLARSIPHSIRDAVYDTVARMRYKLFKRPPDVCPNLPPHLRSRFYL